MTAAEGDCPPPPRPRLVPAPPAEPESKPPEPADVELVLLVQRGFDLDAAGKLAVPGQEAFARLVRRYQAKVLGLAWHLLRDAEDARDVAQETFLRAYRSLAGFRPEGSFQAWLLAIAVNVARDARRRRGAAPVGLAEAEAVPDPAPGSHARAEQAELVERIGRAIAALNDREREVVVLRDVQGFEVAEIATMLAIEPPTVRRHLARARCRLRELLGGAR